jgi:hypothetical protein
MTKARRTKEEGDNRGRRTAGWEGRIGGEAARREENRRKEKERHEEEEIREREAGKKER